MPRCYRAALATADRQQRTVHRLRKPLYRDLLFCPATSGFWVALHEAYLGHQRKSRYVFVAIRWLNGHHRRMRKVRQHLSFSDAHG